MSKRAYKIVVETDGRYATVSGGRLAIEDARSTAEYPLTVGHMGTADIETLMRFVATQLARDDTRS